VIPTRTVTFTNPHTGEVKAVKVGWSWTCFLFSGFFGAPLFRRGLTNWGLVVLGGMFLNVVLSLFGDYVAAGLIYIALTIAFLWLQVFLGVKGNELTAKNYLQQGWVFTLPDNEGVTLAKHKWRIIDPMSGRRGMAKRHDHAIRRQDEAGLQQVTQTIQSPAPSNQIQAPKVAIHGLS
jgi:hypothetical protein